MGPAAAGVWTPLARGGGGRGGGGGAPGRVEPRPSPRWPPWFAGPRDLGSLPDGLGEAGFPPVDRDLVLGGNWLRLFGEVFG